MWEKVGDENDARDRAEQEREKRRAARGRRFSPDTAATESITRIQRRRISGFRRWYREIFPATC